MMYKNDFLRMSRTPIDDMREAVDKMTVMSSFQDDALRVIDSQNFYQDALRLTTASAISKANVERMLGVSAISKANVERMLGVSAISKANVERMLGVSAISKANVERMLGVSAISKVGIQKLLDFPNEIQKDAVLKILEPPVDIKKIALLFADNIQIPPLHNFDSFYKNIEGIFAQEAWVRFDLKSGFWIIEDDEVITHLKENLHTRVDQEYYICDYYSKDAWGNLATIVESWAECKPIRDRHPILKDCFTALKLAQGQDINIANLVVPTLLAQIDGIRDEILDAVPDILSKIKINVEFTPEEFIKKERKIQFSTVRSILSKLISDEYGIIFYEVICEGIFQSGYAFAREKKKGENLNNMNRNKIIHGDKILLDYGTKENLIRAFLCVDFMIKVIVGIQKPE